MPDGTQKGDKLDAIKMRFVRKRDAKILELLVGVRLHDKSVNANVLAINFAKCLPDMRVSPKTWIFAIVDRAGTNKK
eukprot:11203977-Ditylum_brightwellii.AAC.1